MILIISLDQDDSTYDVLKWLQVFNGKYVLITEYNNVESIKIDSRGKISILLTNETLYLEDVDCVWYRRGVLGFKDVAFQGYSKLEKAIYNFQNSEKNKLLEYVNYRISKLPGLSHYFSSRVNKLTILDKAKSVDLRCPKYIVSDSKKDVESFYNFIDGNIINKVISNPIKYYEKDFWLPTYTERLERSTIEALPDVFFESFFQEEIIKAYELRSVFLSGEFYTMAIFSQNDTKTSVDFRKYNHDTPNRRTPFELPMELKQKLKKLLNILELEFCSIDLMVTKETEFYFLEVNPIGQFGMTSYPNNFYLEKKIAVQLNKISNNV